MINAAFDDYILPKTNLILVVTNENNLHLQQPIYLPTKTWKHGGRVYGTEVAIDEGLVGV